MKNSTYKEKFATLNLWMPHIIDVVKKELKNDHLKNDVPFCKKYFGNKNVAKLTLEEMVEGYRSAFSESERVETLGEFIANRWLMKNGDIYKFFAEQLARINPEFSEIVEIDKSLSEAIIREGSAQFDLQDLYLFSVLNAVAFPESVYSDLGANSLAAAKHKNDVEAAAEMEKSMHDHEMRFARMVDKYEKKLSGLEKKYHHDVENLKKQVSRLQKQLVGAS